MPCLQDTAQKEQAVSRLGPGAFAGQRSAFARIEAVGSCGEPRRHDGSQPKKASQLVHPRLQGGAGRTCAAELCSPSAGTTRATRPTGCTSRRWVETSIVTSGHRAALPCTCPTAHRPNLGALRASLSLDWTAASPRKRQAEHRPDTDSPRYARTESVAAAVGKPVKKWPMLLRVDPSLVRVGWLRLVEPSRGR